jgi:hypothetical protein
MKNIQVIDSAKNAIYDIFAATDDEFDLIFPSGQDIAFSEEVWEREPKALLEAAFAEIWKRPVRKRDVNGIHGMLFYGLENKKKYYPTRKDEEAVDPDGTRLG